MGIQIASGTLHSRLTDADLPLGHMTKLSVFGMLLLVHPLPPSRAIQIRSCPLHSCLMDADLPLSQETMSIFGMLLPEHLLQLGLHHLETCFICHRRLPLSAGSQVI